MAKTRVMQPKPSRPALTAEDIKVGKTYRGKNPDRAGSDDPRSGWINDRIVLYIGPVSRKVQYDSSAVKEGSKYPSVTMEAFLKWASHEVF